MHFITDCSGRLSFPIREKRGQQLEAERRDNPSYKVPRSPLRNTRETGALTTAFPQSDLTVTIDTLEAGKSTRWIESALRSPGTSFLTLGDSTLTVFAVPGDTIGINLSVIGGGA